MTQQSREDRNLLTHHHWTAHGELGTIWNFFTNPDSPKHVESQRRKEAVRCHPQSP